MTVDLAARGRGFALGPWRAGGRTVPIVPSACLFDLLNGGDKDWGDTPPYRALGRRALAAAGRDFALGNTGAGLGAKAGALKGGLGSASWILSDGTAVAALVAANPRGSAVEPGSGAFWAAPFEQSGEFGGRPAPAAASIDPDSEAGEAAPLAGAHTTLAVVATDAALTPVECRRLAIMAQDGLARAIRPLHTPFDGDTVFALATGRRQRPSSGLVQIGRVAADCLARATARAVWLAESLGPYPSWRERYG